MAYNEELLERMREALSDHEVREQKMFGGVAFMLRGNMCVWVTDDSMMVRIGPDNYEDALAMPHASEMDFTGQQMKGWVFVSDEGWADDADLEAWVQRGVDFVLTLPAK
jgi:TfoX/Sxy family transcriptional regulator of competence genes